MNRWTRSATGIFLSLPYLDAQGIYGDHLGIDALLGETSLALELLGIVALAMVRNEQRLGFLGLVVGRQVDSVRSRAAAALKAELARLSDKVVRFPATSRAARLNDTGLHATEQAK